METKIYKITDPEKDREKIEEAAEIIKNGGLVAFPTDTVYAVGASIDKEEALKKLFEVKNRPLDNPINVLVARDLDMHLVIDITAPNNMFLTKFIENFWPGPLTIIMPKIENRVSSIITAGGNSVGVRQPKNDIAYALIDAVGTPVAAPSANISGHPSPTTAKHVIDDLNGKIDMILEGPDCDMGIESTIVDLSRDKVVVTRLGLITPEELEEVIPRKVYVASQGHTSIHENDDKRDGEASIFEKYPHYRPNKPLKLFVGEIGGVSSAISHEVAELEKEGKKVGVIDFHGDIEKAAHEFFKELRNLDASDVDIILLAGVPEDGLGEAVMDRMKKAAAGNITLV